MFEGFGTLLVALAVVIVVVMLLGLWSEAGRRDPPDDTGTK
jgi:hypothetical protein